MLPRRIATLTLALAATAAFAIPPGSIAPDFKGTDSNGKTQSLTQYRGKYVVLEWANQGCPYEQKLYHSGTMEKLQKEWTSKGIIWLSVISSAILDPQGAIGHLYQAKTTPHMFVIDPTGKVIYQGAIDDKPSPDPDTLPGAHNYVSAALNEALAGKPVTTAVTRSYGCSVKYQ